MSTHNKIIAEIEKKIEEFKFPYDIEKIQIEVAKELRFTEFNLLESCTANTEVHHRYVCCIWRSKDILTSLKNARSILFNALMLYFKHDHPEILRTRDDKMKHIEAHPSYIKLNTLIENVESAIDYFYRVDKLFNERNYAIGNAAKMLGGG